MKIVGRSIIFDCGLSILFHQTLRLPEDGNKHSLPPSLGYFPIHRVEDFKDKVPTSWLEHGGIFMPMFQREAMWMSFRSNNPSALKVAAGKINAINGKSWVNKLDAEKQDYAIVGTPRNSQPWLDGFNCGDGFIKQFVAMPLGMGYTVEGQLTGKEEFGGIQLLCCPAKEDSKLMKDLRNQPHRGEVCCASGCLEGIKSLSYQGYASKTIPIENIAMKGSAIRGQQVNSTPRSAEIGLAMGGKMKQSVYDDCYGIDTWDQEKVERVYVHIVNSTMYKEITGNNPPESPVTAKSYTSMGLPWFDLYDEGVGKVAKSEVLTTVKTISEMDSKHGFVGQQDDSPVEEGKVITYKHKSAKKPNEVTDGKW